MREKNKIKKKEPKGKIDFYFLFGVLALIILGVLALASAASVYSQKELGTANYYLRHQIFYGFGVGIFFAIIAYFISISFLKKIAIFLVFGNIILMFLVFAPGIGIAAGGAARWLNLGFTTLQPSEPLKLTFILYLSAWLASLSGKKSGSSSPGAAANRGKNNWQITLVPFLCILGFVLGLLYLQSDGSTLMVIFITSLIMYFLAATPFWHTLLLVLAGSGGLFLLIRFTSYRLERFLLMIESWKDPFMIKDPMGLGYQIKQALIAVGSGGLVGVGLGMSNQKIGQFLPHVMSDSIFTIYAEETGFIGSAILVFLFVFIFWRCVHIAGQLPDRFSSLCVVGIGSWFALQAFTNIGSMIGILPLAGIPMPFMSYGGSHILTESMAVGLVLNISRFRKA